MKKIITILIIWIMVCSCGNKKRNIQGYDNDATAKEKAHREVACSWSDAEFLDGEKVLIFAEKMPEYNGGMRNYYHLILKEIRLPTDKRLWKTIMAVFIIDTLGRVRNECIIDKTSTDSLTVPEKELLKAIKNHQDWIPGYDRGKKVAVKLILPVRVGHRGS